MRIQALDIRILPRKRGREQLGLVPGVWRRLGAARNSRDRAVRGSHGRLHAVFRVAATDRGHVAFGSWVGRG
jgi:hypothetical protein